MSVLQHLLFEYKNPVLSMAFFSLALLPYNKGVSSSKSCQDSRFSWILGCVHPCKGPGCLVNNTGRGCVASGTGRPCSHVGTNCWNCTTSRQEFLAFLGKEECPKADFPAHGTVERLNCKTGTALVLFLSSPCTAWFSLCFPSHLVAVLRRRMENLARCR